MDTMPTFGSTSGLPSAEAASTEAVSIEVDRSDQPLGDYMPYKGLMPYEETDIDAAFFFGRENWRDIIINNLRASRLTVLYGSSGVGKSSVLRAGVAYALRQTACQNRDDYGVPRLTVVVFNTWRDDPLLRLKQQVEAEIRRCPNADRYTPVSLSLPLDELLMQWAKQLGEDTSSGKIFIILDQFEEYFLYHDQKASQDDFAIEFSRAVNRPDLPVNFLISLREDSISKLDRFKEAIPSLLSNLLRIEHLDEDSASDAIRKPVREYNRRFRGNHTQISVEPSLVQAVLDQVRTGRVSLGERGRGGLELTAAALAEQPIETPFLQMVMTRLWLEEMKAGSRRLRAETLTRLGGANQIVKEHLDARMGELTAENQAAAAHVFNYLVTPSGTKISQTVDDLVRYVNEEEAGGTKLQRSLVESLLEDLSEGDSRILRPLPPTSKTDPRERYEIFHDVLAEAILGWRRRYLEAQKLQLETTKLAEQQRQETEQQRVRLERRWSRILIVASLCVLGVVGGLSYRLTLKAREQRLTNLNLAGNEALVQFETGNALKALQSAMTVGQTVQQEGFAAEVPTATLALQQILGRIDQINQWPFPQENAIPAIYSLSQSANGQWVSLGTLNGSVYRWQMGDPGWSRIEAADSSVSRTAISNDGQRLAIATADQQILVKDASGNLIGDFSKGLEASFAQIHLSPDGKTLIAHSMGMFRMWDVDSREILPFPGAGAETDILNVWFSDDSQTLAVVSMLSQQASLIQIFNAQGSLLQSWEAPELIYGGRFSPDGQQLATLSMQDSAAVKLWNLQGELQATLKGHRSPIMALSFSDDGQRLATGATDGFVRVWDLQGNEQAVFRGHDSAVQALEFSPDNQALTTVTSLGTVSLWSLQSRNCRDGMTCTQLDVPAARGPQMRSLTEVNPSVDQRFLVVGTADGSAYVWDLEQTASPTIYQGGGQQTWRVRPQVFLSANGEQLATIAADGTARLWHRQNPFSARVLLAGQTHKQAVAIYLDSDQANSRLLTAFEDGSLELQGIDNSQKAPLARLTVEKTEGSFPIATFSSDGQLIATVSGKDNILQLWNQQGNHLADFDGHPGQVSALRFSQDGQRLAVAFLDGTILLANVHSSQVETLMQTGNSVINLRFSPDGQQLATASLDGTARVWNLQGKLLAEYKSASGLWDANFVDHGQQLAIAGMGTDVGIQLWPVENLSGLLQKGCEWLQPYLQTHSEARENFPDCWQGEGDG